MNQFTKGVVIVSTLAAAFLELYLATTPLFPQVAAVAVIGFIAALILRQWSAGSLSAVVLFFVYLAPAIHVVWLGDETFSLEIVWALPLLGCLIANRSAWRWSLPSPWRWPLVAWALFVSVSWPIVFLREVDFQPSILALERVPNIRIASNTSIGIPPWTAGMLVAYTAIVHNLGLLWIDALFRWYADDRIRAFARQVLAPLAIAIVIAGAVGVYQGFVNLEFINPHLWGYMGRASGTLGDANSFGVLAGLWAPAFVVLALAMRWPLSIAVGVGGLGLMSLAVFASGSRTALIVIVLGLAGLGAELYPRWRTEEGIVPRRRMAIVSIAVIVVAIGVALLARGSSLTTVLGRGSIGYIPIVGDLGIRESTRQLWDRYGYAPPAVQMIKEHPWAGVGPGGFHTLVHDFGVVTTRKQIPPDNAQNWYRHMLAELGVLGSAPWMVWCVALAMALFSRSSDRRGLEFGILRGILIAFAIISLVGVPGQSMPVVITFWTFVFWCVSSGGLPPAWLPEYSTRWLTAGWLLTLGVVALHAVVTFADARGDLLPQNRSKRFGWYYRYGISDVEKNADGSPGRMWTWRESMAVIPVKGKVLKFVAWIDHPDADERPVHVRVWADSRLVHDADLKRSAAIFLDIPAAPGQTHMTIKTEIDRLWRPRDFGRNDNRELGLSVRDWTWE